MVSGMRTLPLWIGGALLAAGLVLGFTPLSSQGTSCGAAYNPSQAINIGPRVDDCDGVRSLIRAPALALTVVGGGIVFVGFFAVTDRPRTDEDGAPVQRTVLGRPVGRRRERPGTSE